MAKMLDANLGNRAWPRSGIALEKNDPRQTTDTGRLTSKFPLCPSQWPTPHLAPLNTSPPFPVYCFAGTRTARQLPPLTHLQLIEDLNEREFEDFLSLANAHHVTVRALKTLDRVAATIPGMIDFAADAKPRWQKNAPVLQTRWSTWYPSAML